MLKWVICKISKFSFPQPKFTVFVIISSSVKIFNINKKKKKSHKWIEIRTALQDLNNKKIIFFFYSIKIIHSDYTTRCTIHFLQSNIVNQKHVNQSTKLQKTDQSNRTQIQFPKNTSKIMKTMRLISYQSSSHRVD